VPEVRAAELGRQLCGQHGAGNGRLVWFLPPGSGPGTADSCTRVQMRTFSACHVSGPMPGVELLRNVSGYETSRRHAGLRQPGHRQRCRRDHFCEHGWEARSQHARHENVISALVADAVEGQSALMWRVLDQGGAKVGADMDQCHKRVGQPVVSRFP
jgi:hypothetical protein